MKKFIVIMIVALLSGLQSKAQGPVLKYNNDIYSVEDQKKFTMGKSDTSKAFAQFILSQCQEELTSQGYTTTLALGNLGWLFDSCIVIEEVSLKKGEFYNSSWNRKNKELNFFLSQFDYEGMAGVFKYGRCYKILWKGNCSNAFKFPKKSKPPVIKDDKPKDTVAKPKSKPNDGGDYIPTKTPSAPDLTVTEPVKKIPMGNKVQPEMVRNNWSRPVYDDYYYYPKPRPQVSVFFNITGGRGGGGGQTFNPILGGPAPAPGHPAGGPAPAPGHR